MTEEYFLRGPGRGVPKRVQILSTTRQGGVSTGPFESLNLGFHVGDQGAAVKENRRRFREEAGGEVLLAWLEQVHGRGVLRAEDVVSRETAASADGSVSKTPGVAAVVMTADCLPLVFWDQEATVVGAAHAGWRGLAAGVLEATVEAMEVEPEKVSAWMGPAIGADSFEVGSEVREVFLKSNGKGEALASCFRPSPWNPRDRWVADLYGLAKLRLQGLGVREISGGEACTYREKRFFSYRRDGLTGRMATAIWLLPSI